MESVSGSLVAAETPVLPIDRAFDVLYRTV
jgi:hypothetical protein